MVQTFTLVPVFYGSPHNSYHEAQVALAAAINPEESRWITSIEQHADALRMFRRDASKAHVKDDQPIPVAVILQSKEAFFKSHFLPRKLERHIPHAISICIDRPKFLARPFDVVTNFAYDHHARKRDHQTIVIDAMPNIIDDPILHESYDRWAPLLRRPDRKTIAVCVGSEISDHILPHGFDRETVDRLKTVLDHATKDHECEFILADRSLPGSRTQQFLKQEFAPRCLYTSHEPVNQLEDPLRGFLACADAVIVTPENKHMISQAVASRKPVYITTLDFLLPFATMEFCSHLQRKGRVHYLNGRIDFGDQEPIRSAPVVATAIRRVARAKYPSWHLVS